MSFGKPGADDREWVLIDAGVIGTTGLITGAAEERFGPKSRPAAIVMTHGHFDHVGALEELSERWQAPVYTHGRERPYLDGSAAYPPPDPSVGGGLMSMLSPLYPRGPRGREPLASDLAGGWQRPADARLALASHARTHPWSHIALEGGRPDDHRGRCLHNDTAGVRLCRGSAGARDARPPDVLHDDWGNARSSVELLASLEPDRVITGHGPAVQGAQMRDALHRLESNFDRVAVPKGGKYVETRRRTKRAVSTGSPDFHEPESLAP